MKGRIFIINRENNIGKILLDGGQESLVMTFPASFETGDRVEVKFRNDDINDRVINMSIPGDEWNYGILMNEFYNKNGDILCNYPKIRGLINYSENIRNISSNNVHLPVKFKIKKTANGKVSAVNITKAGKHEIYKCKTPVFGTLKKEIENIQTGFIESIIKTDKQVKDIVISGEVKFVKSDKNDNIYGFIRRDDGGEDVYFNENIFKRFYSKEPEKRDKVNFIIKEVNNRFSVKKFCKPEKEELLPLNKQYGIISADDKKVKFYLSDYTDFYKREPDEGDIVYFYKDGNKMIFKNDDSEVTEKVVLERKKSRFEKGIIKKCHERGFGFIKSDKYDTVFFMLSNFEKKYGEKPEEGDEVYFNVVKNKKGVSVSYFINNPNQKLVCPKDSFKNFIEIERGVLYYVYTDNERVAKEVYRFNPDNLSESISCYKNKNTTNEHKLEALESLIKFNFSDKKINLKKLKNEKIRILSELVKKEIQANNIQKALEYENKLQDMNFKPKNLSKFNFLKPEYRIEFLNVQKFNNINSTEDNWNIEIEKDIIFNDSNNSEEYFEIDLKNNKEIIEIENTEKWQIDFNTPKEPEVINEYNEFNISID